MSNISQGITLDVEAGSLPVAEGVEALISGLDKVSRELSSIRATDPFRKTKIAVLIPCYNEAVSIRKVITDFRAALPGGAIYVYDNRSTDNTAALAREAGAIVRNEPWPGKGNVVRRMFADIEADVYVMADGDATYDTSVAPEMVARLLNDNLDMVVGIRRNVYSNAHRTGHGFGNKLFNEVYRSLFGPMFSDIFSGYRVFSRRFVKSFPSISSGFEIETEMSVHASQVRMPVAEIETDYGAREEGSVSKLRTFHDAFRILRTLFMLFKEIKPAKFFGVIAGTLAISSLLLGYPLLQTYMDTGMVPRFPTAILITGLMLVSAISLVAGLILDSVARGRLENKRMIYLGLASPALKDA